MDTPLIENSSDFDASYDSAHIEKICFCIKIRALLIIHHMVCHLELLNCKLLYIFNWIYALGPIYSPHSLLFPNTSSISTKKLESALMPDLLFRSDSLITWSNTPPRQSAYSSSRAPLDTLDNWAGRPPNDTQFHLPRLSPSLLLSSPTRHASRAPKGGIDDAAESRPSCCAQNTRWWTQPETKSENDGIHTTETCK